MNDPRQYTGQNCARLAQVALENVGVNTFVKKSALSMNMLERVCTEDGKEAEAVVSAIVNNVDMEKGGVAGVRLLEVAVKN